ncbi:hypothetical protein [Burkholderia stagnalis]|uniref:hypothetical protein n=1 Tax=Burkholderia stagnalis TaxID=1503054 RepID=UPI000A40D60F|nr:hypothetical protein [Burkholderia stagnalis]
MPIYEAGQHVRLKDGRSGVIEGVDTETTPAARRCITASPRRARRRARRCA